jgi:hypothetical protein
MDQKVYYDYLNWYRQYLTSLGFSGTSTAGGFTLPGTQQCTPQVGTTATPAVTTATPATTPAVGGCNYWSTPLLGGNFGGMGFPPMFGGNVGVGVGVGVGGGVGGGGAGIGGMTLTANYNDPHTQMCDKEPEFKIMDGKVYQRKVKLTCI